MSPLPQRQLRGMRWWISRPWRSPQPQRQRPVAQAAPSGPSWRRCPAVPAPDRDGGAVVVDEDGFDGGVGAQLFDDRVGQRRRRRRMAGPCWGTSTTSTGFAARRRGRVARATPAWRVAELHRARPRRGGRAAPRSHPWRVGRARPCCVDASLRPWRPTGRGARRGRAARSCRRSTTCAGCGPGAGPCDSSTVGVRCSRTFRARSTGAKFERLFGPLGIGGLICELHHRCELLVGESAVVSGSHDGGQDLPTAVRPRRSRAQSERTRRLRRPRR